MGSSRPVQIHFTSKLKNCFVNVSPLLEREWSGIWKDDNIVKAIRLDIDNNSIYTSWSGQTFKSLQESHEIEISRTYGERLGLNDKQEVVATPLQNVKSCELVTFLPTSRSDWEIAEINSNLIESSLINQVRIIWEGAIIPVWVQKSNFISVKVGEVRPSAPCSQLEELTEIRITPWQNLSETTTEESERLSRTKGTSVDIAPLSLPSNDKISDSEQLDKSRVSSNPNTNIVKRSFSSSLGRSLHQAGDKYEQSYSPIDPLSGIRVGVVNFVRSVVLRGPHSAEFIMKGDDEKSLIYPTTNKLQLHGLKRADSGVTKGRKSVLKQSPQIPIDCYYRVQDLATCDDVTALPKIRSRMQSSLQNVLEQPSTVFVYCPDVLSIANRLVNYKHRTDETNISNRYISMMASIHKLHSVKERVDMNSASKRSDIGSNDSTPNDELKESDPAKLFERKYLESSMNAKQRSVSPSDKASFGSSPTATVRVILTSERNIFFGEKSENRSLLREDLLRGHIAVNGLLRRQLKLGVKSSVLIKKIHHNPTPLLGIVLNPFGENAKKIKSFHKNELVTAFTSWILETTKEYPLVLASRMLIAFHITPDIKCEFLLSGIGTESPNSNSRNPQYFFVYEETLKNASISVGDVIQPSYYLILSPYPAKNTLVLDQDFSKCPISSLGGFDEMYRTCFNFLLHGLSYQPISKQLCRSNKPSMNTLLIYGSGSTAGGSGKSSLAYALCNQLGKHPFLAYVTVIECISLRGKRVETIRKSWQQAFSNSAWNHPTVVLFDDLDQLISAPSLIQEHGPEANYTLRLAQVFKDLLRKEVRLNSQVVVIATATSRDSIHPSLLTSHGNHVFSKTVEIPLPDVEQRYLMLNAILRRKQMSLPREDVRVVAVKTEGCSPKDLNTVVARACQVSTTRQKQLRRGPMSSITLQDLTKALECFRPASLHGIKLHQGIDLKWKDVGGLQEIKRTLMETLEWPTKFPAIFANIPTRLPCGILLYGPPGTGKTMLAGVVANECSLNFISIKGPELLSKYIGASEQAVRDLFHRAQSAKPCVLFFDEFDSMAPRRGHDSTGVTDRVVNQLLTQLDGVEGLDGVYILAATSRPDLIDPALLRPGRLDKSLYCGMPDEGDRLEILKALSAKLSLHQGVDFAKIAKETSDFSGADLKALLSNAQLKRIHQMKTTISGKTEDPLTKSKIFRMPQLQHGPRQLDMEEHAKLGKQVAVLQDNFFKSVYGKANKSPKPDFSHDITIQHNDIMEALGSMAPSVSPEEKIRYTSIYQSFQSKKSTSSQIPVIKQRATLA